MPRAVSVVVTALLAVAMLSFAVAASATPAVAVDGDVLILATEGGAEGEVPPGLDPMPADATDNPAAPPEYEANFLWGAAVGLLVLTLLGAGLLGALYFVLVWRPNQKQSAGT